MQIQQININNTRLKPNFTAKPLYNIKLLDNAGNKITDALVVELEKGKKEDLKALEEIEKTCDRNDIFNVPNRLFLSIIDHFKSNKNNEERFFAVTTPYKKKLNILGCMYTSPNEKTNKTTLFLDKLFVRQDVANRNNQRKIKGVGEALLGESITLAKDAKYKALEFLSIADEFYDHSLNSAKVTNYREKNCSFFHIKEDFFDKFIKYCSNKYNIQK